MPEMRDTDTHCTAVALVIFDSASIDATQVYVHMRITLFELRLQPLHSDSVACYKLNNAIPPPPPALLTTVYKRHVLWIG